MSSWGESPADFTGEPRKVFINLLIWDIKQIQYTIFFQRRPSHAIQPLMGLVDSLDTKSKETLKPTYDTLEAMRLGKAPIRTGDVEKLYRDILNYLHKTYLSEARFARPRAKTPGRLKV